MEEKSHRRASLLIEKELVLNKEKVYVLKDEELRVEIIWLHHDVLAVEYEGR